MNPRYKDIIDLPHHVSKTRTPMTLYDRAAQFAPYDALAGYSASTAETARLTDRKIELAEGEIEALDRMLGEIYSALGEAMYAITYFVPDKKKSGGAYLTTHTRVLKIDEYKKAIYTDNGLWIAFSDIYSIEEIKNE